MGITTFLLYVLFIILGVIWWYIKGEDDV